MAIAQGANKRHVFGPNGPSEKWWRGFKGRHPDISLRRPDQLDRGRTRMANENVVREYFELLDTVIKEADLQGKPHLIFNCDETAIDLNKSTQKVIVPVRQKHAYLRGIGSTQHISVHCCINAAGHTLPPMIIFSGGFPGGPYNRNGPEDALYATSDSELYLAWFEKIFLKYTPDTTRLLLQDGHASHINIKLIDKAIENNVVLMCLPPHTTHLLQSLDVAVYKSLKAKLSKTLGAARLLSPDLWISKKNFSALFREHFENCMVAPLIKQGFRKCGIYPLDPTAIDLDVLKPSQVIPLIPHQEQTSMNGICF